MAMTNAFDDKNKNLTMRNVKIVIKSINLLKIYFYRRDRSLREEKNQFFYN
jgi:hypothetical protein